MNICRHKCCKRSHKCCSHKCCKRSHKRSKRSHKRSHKRSKRNHKTYKKMRGGNYEKDVTTREFEGVSIKPLNKIVVTAPGLVLSGAAYVNLMENRDRNGTAY